MTLQLARGPNVLTRIPTMSSRYTYNKDEAKFKVREKSEVVGCVPHG
jgi:hypothetical protein